MRNQALPSNLISSLSLRNRAAVGQRVVVPLFCFTLFCSSGLLFLAEPMFAKMVLPLLGGTPGVWNTCMVSFQTLLLAAYAYGHWSIQYFGIRRQALLQLFLLCIIALMLPIAIPHDWSPTGGQNPIVWLLTVLPIGVGLPFFAVASTAPILQRWFSTTGHRDGSDPYFLYVASNLGSMAGLLAYPTIIEPLLRLHVQSQLWSTGYLSLAVLVGCCALFIKTEAPMRTTKQSEKISRPRRIRWILLAMIPSSLLLGTTTFITTDIAAVPLLWIVPLAIYLLSFILVFSSRTIVSHRLMVRLQPVVVLSVAIFMLGRVAQPAWLLLCLHLAALFVSSMVCHGELANDRPGAGGLTDFYLTMSLGGMLGGLFNALLAPVLFQAAAEYPMALIAVCAICPPSGLSSSAGKGNVRAASPLILAVPLLAVLVAIWLPRTLVAIFGYNSMALRMTGLGSAILMTLIFRHRRLAFIGSLAGLFFFVGTGPANGEILAIRRSFFGIHRVVRNPDGPFNDLYHGTTVHGRQFVDSGDKAATPLTYYHRTGPIGQILLQRTAAGHARRIGVVGMGVGSLAAYAEPATDLTYYEIDPAVRWLAHDSGYFTFLRSAETRGATVHIVMGDARLTLRQAPAHGYDVLVLDAFCGDAIPVHLLTREAMAIYQDKLADHGVLAIHISNLYLNLLPVCAGLATDAHAVGLHQDDLDVSPQQSAIGKSASQWVLIAKSGQELSAEMSDPRWQPLPTLPDDPVWTDDFSNILGVFRWR